MISQRLASKFNQTSDSFQRTFNSLSTLQFQLGLYNSPLYDNLNLGATQIFKQIEKVFKNQPTGLVNQNSFSTYNSGTGTQFLIAMDLEAVDSALSGESFDQITVKLENTSSITSTQYDNYIHYDGFLVLKDGNLQLYI
jgi:hypothetical protein